MPGCLRNSGTRDAFPPFESVPSGAFEGRPSPIAIGTLEIILSKAFKAFREAFRASHCSLLRETQMADRVNGFTERASSYGRAFEAGDGGRSYQMSPERQHQYICYVLFLALLRICAALSFICA